jgi:hypothetical protein
MILTGMLKGLGEQRVAVSLCIPQITIENALGRIW